MPDQEIHEYVIRARITPEFHARVWQNIENEGIETVSLAIRQALGEWCESRERRRLEAALQRGANR